MKKLLAVALSAVLVFAMAAVSMAEVSFSGEIKAVYNFEQNSDAKADWMEGNLKINATISDSVTAFAELGIGRGVTTNDIYIKVTGDLGELQFGRFDFGPGVTDLLTKPLADYKGDVAFKYSNKLTDELTVALGWIHDEYAEGDDVKYDIGSYQLQVAYDTDTFGGNITVQDTNVEGDELGWALSGYYNFTETLQAYVQVGYSPYNDDEMYQIIGAKGDIGETGLSFRVEYELNDEVDEVQTGDYNPWAFRLNYNLENGLKFEYNRKHDGGFTNELSCKVEF
ncbi:MAG TPA: hypothetical protein PLH87_00875 [Bacillota bacterium]|nr:hypothetical protein [Bacillota bacterium]